MQKSVFLRTFARAMAVSLCAALTFGPALPARADIDVLPDGAITSETNPGAIEDYESSWREGWGNARVARFKIKVPTPTPGQPAILGGMYAISKPPTGTILLDESLWPRCYNSPLVTKDYWFVNVDMAAETAYPGPLHDASIVQTGTVLPIEGRYWLPFQFYTKDRPAVAAALEFGVDMTAPEQVTQLEAWVGHSTVPAVTLTDQTRVRLTWEDKVYDQLAGVARFETFIDGDLTDFKVYDGKEHYPGAGTPIGTTREMTIEEMPLGVHEVQVRAVDRAGNAGPLSEPVVIDVVRPDSEQPVVEIVAPTTGPQEYPSPMMVFAVGSDDGKVAEMRFLLDGAPFRTFTPSVEATRLPAGALVPAGTLASGTHTLTVEVDDSVGKTTVAARRFVVNESIAPRGNDYITSEIGTLGGATETNPGDLSDAQAFWRVRWGNTLYPHFEITSPNYDIVDAASVYYLINRSPYEYMSWAGVDGYWHSSRDDGTTFSNTLDMVGVLAADPTLAAAALYGAKASAAAEGIWYYHVLFADTVGNTVGPFGLPYGIDVTKPARVTGLGAYDTPSAVTQVSGTLASSRVHLRWSNAEWDKMSGTAYYKVYLDGECAIPGDIEVLDPAAGGAGVPWYKSGLTTASVTIEDLPSGMHSLQVSAVDRAGNEGQLSTAVNILVDREVPGVTVLTPSAVGGLLGVNPTLSAKVTDDVGVATVSYYVDSVFVGSKSISPTSKSTLASLVANLSSFSNGPHTLEVRATDVAGRVTSGSRDFVLDKTKPVISSVSGAPSPFYPRKRDGYKDNFVVRFKSSEACTAKLTIKDSTGKVWRTMTKSVPVGSSSFSWNGKSNTGTMKSGTFRWTVQLYDGAGNKSSAVSGSAVIKYYEIVYVGGGARVIQR